jgi:phosphoserine phosphatase
MSEANGPISIPPESQARVFRVIEKLAASSDLGPLLALIIDSMRDCLAAERATVFQYDEAAKELFISHAHGVSGMRFPITKGIAGEAARTRQIINVHDAWEDPRFNPEFDKKSGFRTRGMLTIPLISFDGHLQGVAQVLNKNPSLGPYFDHTDDYIARILAGQAAIGIRRARLMDAEIRKNKIEGDLAVARSIQQASIPKELPRVPGYDIAARMSPAEETGGDTFDAIDLQPFTGKPGLMFMMGDATGHGIGPALSVAQARAMVRMGVRLGTDIDRIAANVNAQLCEDLPPGRFITACLGRLDPEAHEIRYVAPGQAPLLVVRADGTHEERSANAMPMGIDPDLFPDDVTPIRLGPGDVFLLLSDGFLEAMNHKGDQFGMERTLTAIRAAFDGGALEILESVNTAVLAFAAGRPFGDDQTAVIIKRQSGKNP